MRTLVGSHQSPQGLFTTEAQRAQRKQNSRKTEKHKIQGRPLRIHFCFSVFFYSFTSPETNAMLRSKSNGVAKKSQHLLGNAIDVRLRGLDLEVLRDTASTLKLGGLMWEFTGEW